MTKTTRALSFRDRIERLRKTKLEHTAEKQSIIGAMDYDDWALVLPPPELRDITELIGPSGAPMRDVKIKGVPIESNHRSGGFFGPEIVGLNFRRLLEAHPVYIDPMSSLAGAYMTNFFSYRKPHWNPDIETERFDRLAERYHVYPGIGGVQHFCQDLSIGLDLGWGGLLAKIDRYEALNDASCRPFYAGLRHVVAGVQNWISRHAARAEALAEETELRPERAGDSISAAEAETTYESLRQTAQINRRLVTEAPENFVEACQWILWFQLVARMYDGSGSLGAIDQLLWKFYNRDASRGTLADDEAVFYLACLLVRDTGYSQLGGYDAEGNDTTNALSYLVLDAVEALRIPANIGVCVGERIDPELLRRGVEIQFRHKSGVPKFLGIDNTATGFARNGYPIALGYHRIYSGCHWCAVPGREYTMNDIIKVNLARIFEITFDEYVTAHETHDTGELWIAFEAELRGVIRTIAEGVDLHLEHQHEVFPELPLDLLCHGPVERGHDIADGGVDLYNIGIDAAGLSVAADSFAAIAERVEAEAKLEWRKLHHHVRENWSGPEGERARHLMMSTPRYGYGGSTADEYARRISRLFSDLVKESPTPKGVNLIPGLFSWALAPAMGRRMGATPDGRRAGDPLAHGANPSPGFRTDNAATALATAVASVQPGWGQAAPLQLDFDPGLTAEAGGVELVSALIRTHFDLGGTQINLNVMDADRVLEAYQDPGRYPELVVRVTGFSAYFASLSPELRKFVVDRIVSDAR
jgi:pyruvate-formate lyase